MEGDFTKPIKINTSYQAWFNDCRLDTIPWCRKKISAISVSSDKPRQPFACIRCFLRNKLKKKLFRKRDSDICSTTRPCKFSDTDRHETLSRRIIYLSRLDNTEKDCGPKVDCLLLTRFVTSTCI